MSDAACNLGVGARLCLGMASRIRDDYGAPGLSRVDSMRDRDIVTIGVKFARDRSDRGILLNFCPWCGTDYRPALAAHKAATMPAEVAP